MKMDSVECRHGSGTEVLSAGREWTLENSFQECLAVCSRGKDLLFYGSSASPSPDNWMQMFTGRCARVHGSLIHNCWKWEMTTRCLQEGGQVVTARRWTRDLWKDILTQQQGERTTDRWNTDGFQQLGSLWDKPNMHTEHTIPLFTWNTRTGKGNPWQKREQCLHFGRADHNNTWRGTRGTS